VLSVLNYLLYFAVDLILFLVASYLYVKFTVGDEIAQISGGNRAAAVALTGTLISFALVIYTATQHGNLLGTMIWSIVALAVQIGVFELLRLLVPDDWKQKIDDGDLAHGIALGAFSLAIGIINAGCIT
jgi:putative membrane protein